MLKLHSNGDVAWQNTYGGSDWDTCHFIDETFDQSGDSDGYILVGRTHSFGAGNADILVMKLHVDGTIAWQKTYGDSEVEWASSIRQTLDRSGLPDGYVVAGETSSFGAGGYDMWVLKLNLAGTVVWQKTYGGGELNDAARSIQQSFDQSGLPDGYVVAGSTRSFGAGDWDYWILKLNPNGSIAWQKTFGGVGWDVGGSIQQASDVGYVVSGHTESFGAGWNDIWVLKLDANGEIPNCSAVGMSEAVVTETSIEAEDASSEVQESFAVIDNTAASSQGTSAQTSLVCPEPPPVCECELVPDAIPTVIPRGTPLGFQASITNNTGGMGTVLFGTKVTKPDASQTGFIWGPLQVYLNPHQTKSGHKAHTIPSGFELGTYTYHGYVGRYGNIYHECQFDFEVVP